MSTEVPSNTLQQETLWRGVQERVKEQMSLPSFETWIAPLALTHTTNDQAFLLCESSFSRDWVLKHYKQSLNDAFTQELQRPISIELSVQTVSSTASNAAENADSILQLNEVKASRPWTPRTNQCKLNPKYTFENFVVGAQNHFAHAAALAIAETPAQSYNPFFIYGGVGLGKTHLMHAIGHFSLQYHPDLKLRYVTAEQFTNDLIQALSQKNMQAFRDRYRRNDILLIDDIQFLEGKERTQEEVFHTFNALHESGKQIVLSSDRPPKYLASLEDRLRSRFEWGLIADIQAPDLETRIAILKKKAEREHLELPSEIIDYIAEIHPSNIRELEGALNKVAAYGMLTRSPLSLPVVKTLLGNMIDTSNVNLDALLEMVAQYYHLRAKDLKSQLRAKDISHARQVAIYIIRSLTDSSFPKIGELLGGRKHTTILYAFEKIREELETHPILAQQVEELIRRAKSKAL